MNPIAQWRSPMAAAICLTAIAMPTAHASQTPTARDLSTVIDMLRSSDPVVRTGVACSRKVFNASAAAAIPALIDMLDDDEPVAPEVCREDGRQWWGDDRRPITPGQEAARALVRIGAASFDPLVNALTGAGPTARRNAAWALGALDDAAAVDALVSALKDGDARVREQAAWALGAIGDSRASSGLSTALADSEARVRRQAAWAIGAIAD